MALNRAVATGKFATCFTYSSSSCPSPYCLRLSVVVVVVVALVARRSLLVPPRSTVSTPGAGRAGKVPVCPGCRFAGCALAMLRMGWWPHPFVFCTCNRRCRQAQASLPLIPRLLDSLDSSPLASYSSPARCTPRPPSGQTLWALWTLWTRLPLAPGFWAPSPFAALRLAACFRGGGHQGHASSSSLTGVAWLGSLVVAAPGSAYSGAGVLLFWLLLRCGAVAVAVAVTLAVVLTAHYCTKGGCNI